MRKQINVLVCDKCGLEKSDDGVSPVYYLSGIGDNPFKGWVSMEFESKSYMTNKVDDILKCPAETNFCSMDCLISYFGKPD